MIYEILFLKNIWSNSIITIYNTDFIEKNTRVSTLFFIYIKIFEYLAEERNLCDKFNKIQFNSVYFLKSFKIKI